ncbi:hypothetical protein LUQ84_000959 [Hamiltosporidium tvaerminnensis]|nr:hypothetical protein LUQ84_000959 [Hamiltosporidium tvaerminnensis]
MIINSWPKPLIRKDESPPIIPKEYTCFGVNFIINQDGVPRITENKNIKEIPFKEIKNSIERSLLLFNKVLSKIIKDKDPSKYIKMIRDVHLNINQMISDSRYFEAKESINMLMKEKRTKCKEMEQKINEMLENFSQ